MSGSADKKIRKQLRITAQESVAAFQTMIKRQSFGRRVQLAWKILINKV